MKVRPTPGPLALLAFTFGWAALTYYGRAPAGVTASDPYVYAQMAVDLVEHHTWLHAFPLVTLARTLNLPQWPLVHVGYHVPAAQSEWAAAVWPPGTAVWLALGYALNGERGLFWVTPTLGLLTLAVTAWLSYELFNRRPVTERLWLAALTAFGLATAYRQIELSLTPMSDIPAQLFAALAGVSALRAARARPASWRWGALAGLGLGAAYLTRYTQLLSLAPLLFVTPAFAPPGQSVWQKWRWLFSAGLTALPFGLFSLFYHWQAFGSPFTPASANELALFSLSNVGPVGVGVLQELLRPNEYRYLTPLLLAGLGCMWKNERRELGFYALWLVALVGPHLPYAALRLRGLLTCLPILAGLVAAGVVGGVRWIQTATPPNRQPLWLTLWLVMIIGLFSWRSRYTLLLPLGRPFTTFGYLSSPERNSLAEIERLVPPEGVVGCSLNSGAVDLHAHRATFRPAYWTAAELAAFWEALQAHHRAAYLLVDGEEMAGPLAWAQTHTRASCLWRGPLPYFTPNGLGATKDVELWELQ